MTKTKKKILTITSIVVAVIISIYIITAFTVCRILLNEMFCRVETDNELTTNFLPEEIDIEKREIEFDSGKNTLRGIVWGEKERDKLVVISHGLGGCSADYYPEMMFFVDKGYRVMTFDNTGTGKSEGKGTIGLSQSATDLHNALLFTENDDELNNLPVFLFGHSWGGHAVAAVLNYNHKNVKAVASVAGYNSNGGIMLEWMKGTMGMGGFAYLIFPFAAGCAYADAHSAYNKTAIKGINGADIPVLAVQGGKDDTVWDDSIYNHRDEIINEKFETYFIDNGTHNGVFNPDDEEIKAYRESIYSKWKQLKEQYGGEIPVDKQKEFYAGIEKNKYNGTNNEMLSKVCNFYSLA